MVLEIETKPKTLLNKDTKHIKNYMEDLNSNNKNQKILKVADLLKMCIQIWL